MSKDAKQRQKAALKRKKREQKKNEIKVKQRSSIVGGAAAPTIKSLADLPIHECVISKGWEERGLAHILLAKELPNGKIVVGGWYLDIFAMGVKDSALLPGLDLSEYEERIKPNIFNDDVEFEDCDPALAVALVDGAAEYGEKLGFRPNKRWEESRSIFAGITPAEDLPAFGKEGKPCYVKRGETNSAAIIARLTRSVGEGNFTVVEGEEEA